MYKNFDRYYVEFFMTANTTILQRLLYEYLASKTIKEYQYIGTETDYTLVPSDNASLGVNSLGVNPLGATITAPEDLLKYRRFKKVPAQDFFEYQAQYECDSEDASFYIVCQGANVKESKSSATHIIN